MKTKYKAVIVKHERKMSTSGVLHLILIYDLILCRMSISREYASAADFCVRSDTSSVPITVLNFLTSYAAFNSS
jgi:hypothetical protein